MVFGKTAMTDADAVRQSVKSLLVSCVLVAIASLELHAAHPHLLMREYNHAWQLAGQLRVDEAIPLLKQIIAKDKTFSPGKKADASSGRFFAVPEDPATVAERSGEVKRGDLYTLRMRGFMISW
jgi:hypothetical protein